MDVLKVIKGLLAEEAGNPDADFLLNQIQAMEESQAATDRAGELTLDQQITAIHQNLNKIADLRKETTNQFAGVTMLFFGLVENVRKLVTDVNFERMVADLPNPEDLEGEL